MRVPSTRTRADEGAKHNNNENEVAKQRNNDHRVANNWNNCK